MPLPFLLRVLRLYLRICHDLAGPGGRNDVLEDRRVPGGGPVQVHQSLACSQRREESDDGNAL